MVEIPKNREILLNEDITEQDFVELISALIQGDCFIYAVIPDWEEDLLNELSDKFS